MSNSSQPASVLLQLLAQEHFQALCIAAASSTDNFLVGLALGTELQYSEQSSSSSQQHPPHALVWGIAASNAVGCYLATATGSAVLQNSAGIQHVVAGTAFAYLGYKEYSSCADDSAAPANGAVPQQGQQNGGQEPQRHLPPTFWQLALPMTLNNLAGGVASGVAGLSSLTATSYAFLISAIFMYAGLSLGARITRRQHHRKEKVDNEDSAAHQHQHRRIATLVSVALYSVLALQSFYEAIS